ncbi:ABC transporter ATP-binding protein [Lysinibacillus parviboronicapiens]|uniref:ABC transporter ATP-binding protein n=1 Tax=Lysinibacillus parviboronicapiens TaxID=436516 RepID=UPI001EE69D54|nr:ABC transporter ATP-binding protein [Lysinibacillus parviboronicapiens]
MLLVASNLSNVYANNRGLKNASFSVRSGRILALAGGNGAGKSTLLRLLTGQEKPLSGELIWQERQAIRFMPDDIDFPSMLTATEVIQLLASLKSVGSNEQEKVLKRVGLWDVKKQKVQQFSKGMRQRLNLAQSLLGNGSLLILDEPTNGLDPYWIAELKKIILQEKAKGCTVVFSTHLLAFAEEIADDILVLHDGEILMSGDLKEILAEENYTTLENLWLKKLNL